MGEEEQTKRTKYNIDDVDYSNNNNYNNNNNKNIKMDETVILSIKKSLLNLERNITNNRELRVKYNNQPTKFMDSECGLYNELQSFIMKIPETIYFPIMIELKFVDTLFELLSHENTDICVCVLQILLDMTDAVDLLSYELVAEQLFDSFGKNSCLKIVLDLLKRFQQEQEIDNFEICFSLMDNLLEYDRESISKIPEVVGDILIYLLEFIKYDERDKYITLKLHASDILAVLLQMDMDNNKIFYSKNGVQLLIDILTIYKNNNPLKGEERELMETLFDVLCACLLFDFNKEQFYEYDGLSIIISILKAKKKSCLGAIKVLSFLLSSH